MFHIWSCDATSLLSKRGKIWISLFCKSAFSSTLHWIDSHEIGTHLKGADIKSRLKVAPHLRGYFREYRSEKNLEADLKFPAMPHFGKLYHCSIIPPPLPPLEQNIRSWRCCDFERNKRVHQKICHQSSKRFFGVCSTHFKLKFCMTARAFFATLHDSHGFHGPDIRDNIKWFDL